MVAADLNRSLVIDTVIEPGDSGVVISAVMAQTQSLSDYIFSLYEMPSEQNDKDLVVLTSQSPLVVNSTTHKLGRTLSPTALERSQKAIFVMQERLSYYTMSLLTSLYPQDQFCINVNLALFIQA